MSRYQHAQLTRLHGEWLAFGLPGVRFAYERHLVDFALSTRKPWRDVYHHDVRGEQLGWTRFSELDPTAEFTHDGILVQSRDALGRCQEGVRVKYGIPERARRRDPWQWPPLSYAPTGERVRYDYANPADRRGFPVPVP